MHGGVAIRPLKLSKLTWASYPVISGPPKTKPGSLRTGPSGRPSSAQPRRAFKRIFRITEIPIGRPAGNGATATAGRSSSAVWGLAQCRGDVPRQDCSLCLAAAAKEVASSCRGSSDGRVFYDYCLLRYSTSNFVGLADTGYTLILLNTQNATGVDLAAFDRAQGKLMSRVASEAGGAQNKGLATDTTRLGGDGGGAQTTIDGLGWCTRDITAADCGLCVAQAVAELPNYCRYRRGCRVIYSSCMARYEVYPFFFPLDSAGESADEVGQCDKIVLNYP